jgi:hypothetical protein
VTRVGRRAVLVALAVVLATAACRTAPVYNVDTSLAGPPNTKLTVQQVGQAIWRAGNRLGWRMEQVSPGVLTGTLNLRRHVAVVSITHDTATYRITYKDSSNLLYENGQIHRRYNQWVQNLEQAIRRELAGLAGR